MNDENDGRNDPCGACGNPNPKELRECPVCYSTKCENCDIGDDVCAACPPEGNET